MGTYNDTGVVFFFDAETKEFISKVSIAKSDRQLAEAVQKAKED